MFKSKHGKRIPVRWNVNFAKNPSVPKTRPLHVLVLIILALTWGSSFILMKYGMKTADGTPVFTPNQVASLRLSLAALALSPISIPAIIKLKWTDLRWIMVVGLIGSGIPAFLFTNSQKFLDSSIAGILNALTPLFTLLVGIFLFKIPSEPRQVVGVLIGLAGAAALVSLKGFGPSSHWEYALLVALATFSYGLSVNTVQYRLKHVSALQITSISLLFAGIPCAIYGLSNGVIDVVQTDPNGWTSFGYVTILALGGTAMANLLYFWLTKETSALIASSVTYLMPLVAAMWGVLDGESLHFGHALCGLIILSGVWLVSGKKLK